MTVTDTSDPDRNFTPANMHTDAQQGGATPLNMHTDIVVGSSGSTVTITGHSVQGDALTVTLPKKVADKVKAKVPHSTSGHSTSSRDAKAATSTDAPVYHFDTSAKVTGDATQGLVISGPASLQGVSSSVALTIDPDAVTDLGAQRADL